MAYFAQFGGRAEEADEEKLHNNKQKTPAKIKFCFFMEIIIF